MKRGGQVIYGGKLGVQSQIMIEYFQVNLHYMSMTINLEFSVHLSRREYF